MRTHRAAQRRGELRAERARSQDPQRHVRARAGGRGNAGAPVVGEIALQLHHVAREGIGVAVQRPPHRLRDALVRSRCAPQPQVDPPRKERIERAELFGDDQRRMVGQHDPACADADRRRRGGDMADHHRGRGAGDPAHAVMLGDPIALEAERLGMARQVGGVRQGLRDGAAFDDGHQIEQGKACHDGNMGVRAIARNHSRACRAPSRSTAPSLVRCAAPA